MVQPALPPGAIPIDLPGCPGAYTLPPGVSRSNTDQLPHDADAERAVIVVALSTPEVLGKALEISPPSNFFDRVRQGIATAIVATISDGETPDVTTVTRRLADHSATKLPSRAALMELQAISEMPYVGGAEQHARVIRDHYIRRERILIEQDRIAKLRAGKRPLEDVDREADERVAALGCGKSSTDEVVLSPIGEFTAGVIETIERRSNGDEPPIPVPFADYAASLDGGLRPGIETIVGGTGGNKSQLIAQKLRHAANCGIPSLLISLELTQHQAALRLLCDCAGVSWSKCEKGQASDLDLSALRAIKADLDALPISVEYGRPQRYTVTDVAAHVEALRKKHPTGAAYVAVDFAQLVGTDNKGDIREKFGSVMYDLQSIARTYDLAMTAVSSTSRANYSLLADIEQSAKLTIEHGERVVGNPTAILSAAKEAGEAEFASEVVWVLAGWPTRFENGDGLVIAAQAKYRWSGVKRWFAMANHGGHLHEYHVNSMDDLPRGGGAVGAKEVVSEDEYVRRVIETINKNPGKLRSSNDVVGMTRGTAAKIREGLKTARRDGLVTESKDGFFCVAETHL